MKKIAVLIPSYKPKEYFERCLLSLEKQTLSKSQFCVYIALNGPKDSYEEYILNVIKKMSFTYKYIYIEETGVSNARNKLLDYSKEEFIAFIDDDDLVSKNYLENLLDVSTEWCIGVSNVYNFKFDINDLTENYIGISFKKLANNETSKYKARKYFSNAVAKLIHTNIIQDSRFDLKLTKGEDSLFMTIISQNAKSIQKTSKDTCYYVYERDDSASRRRVKTIDEIKTSAHLIKKYMQLILKKRYNMLFIATRIFAALRKPFNYGK